jgi:hypothetical protein
LAWAESRKEGDDMEEGTKSVGTTHDYIIAVLGLSINLGAMSEESGLPSVKGLMVEDDVLCDRLEETSKRRA